MIQCPNCKTKLEFPAVISRSRRARTPTIVTRKCNNCSIEFETVEVLRKEYDSLKKLEMLLTGVKIDLVDLVRKIEDYEEKV